MLRKAKPKVCEWCKSTEKVQIHHIDHDRENNDLDNLTWLCHLCNLLEAYLWHLQQENRIVVHHEGNRMVIEFTGEQT